MPQPAYSVFEIQPEWVLEPEGMGSKEKFWYRAEDGEPEWLFKFPQPNTGQHWAEKIAAEVAACMDVLHGVVELAVFQGTRGSATESFARDGRELFHGNQILAGKVHGYDPATKFRQCDHTLANIFLSLERTFTKPAGAHRAKVLLAEYLVLDAVIGNTDRHHENWGIMRKQVGDRWQGLVAPTFDHASSLRRELLDEGEGKSRRQILRQQDKRGLSPLELARQTGTSVAGKDCRTRSNGLDVAVGPRICGCADVLQFRRITKDSGMKNRTLFLAWQDKARTRSWFPVGRLDVGEAASPYRFRYVPGAERAHEETGFEPLVDFPDFHKPYDSSELFPLFKNRVLTPGRKDFDEYLRLLQLHGDADPIEILSVDGGYRATDSFHEFQIEIRDLSRPTRIGLITLEVNRLPILSGAVDRATH